MSSRLNDEGQELVQEPDRQLPQAADRQLRPTGGLASQDRSFAAA